jgi:hypothetical protein
MAITFPADLEIIAFEGEGEEGCFQAEIWRLLSEAPTCWNAAPYLSDIIPWAVPFYNDALFYDAVWRHFRTDTARNVTSFTVYDVISDDVKVLHIVRFDLK